MKNRREVTYKEAYQYLLNMLPVTMSKEDLDQYFVGDRKDFSSIQEIFEQFIQSAQNYQGVPNVIKFDKRRDKIKEILMDFNLSEISKMDVEKLYHTFRQEFKVNSRDSNFNSWKKWSNSVIDSAKFLCEFESLKEFQSFVAQFDYNIYTREALPLLISTRIKGIGFALACDIIKELGYLWYPKPDTHLSEVFYELGLSESKEPIMVFEAIVNMADECKKIDPDITPYKLDKIIWLICSGNFYLDNCKVKPGKKSFIEHMKIIYQEKIGLI